MEATRTRFNRKDHRFRSAKTSHCSSLILLKENQIHAVLCPFIYPIWRTFQLRWAKIEASWMNYSRQVLPAMPQQQLRSSVDWHRVVISLDRFSWPRRQPEAWPVCPTVLVLYKFLCYLNVCNNYFEPKRPINRLVKKCLPVFTVADSCSVDPVPCAVLLDYRSSSRTRKRWPTMIPRNLRCSIGMRPV